MEKYFTAGQATNDNTIRGMCIACWIPKATNTVTISNGQYFSMPTMVTETHLNVQCLSVLFILSEMLFSTTNTGMLIRP